MKISVLSRLEHTFHTLVLVVFGMLLIAALLFFMWQDDRSALTYIIGSAHDELSLVSATNRHLKRQNQLYQKNITKKDVELKEKSEELATKQNELSNLSKELSAKGKDLSDKIKELSEAERRIEDQKSQLSANASELTKLRNRPPLFSFQVKASKLSDVEAKKESVRQVVTSAYDMIEELYGKPYLLHSVTITFVDKFTNEKAGGEIVITNSNQGLDIDIRIKDFDKNNFNDVDTIIHEVTHSFHGLAVLEPPAFEEGIAVAATDAVMKRLIESGEIPNFPALYIRLTESEFQSFQNDLSIPRDATAFYTNEKVADFYQLLGKAWYNLYAADNQFFIKFNERLYSKKHNGSDIALELVLDTVREVAPNASLTGAAWNLK